MSDSSYGESDLDEDLIEFGSVASAISSSSAPSSSIPGSSDLRFSAPALPSRHNDNSSSCPASAGTLDVPPLEPTTPCHHELNYDQLATYIYPTNVSLREYQFNIVHRSLFSNVLCALPTGLGKTFIAAAVMLNFYRWFSSGKIIFMAPTRPLVSQQVKACLSLSGISSNDSAVLMGSMPAPVRQEAWASKRVIFATPQTVENDLSRGAVDPLSICLLVVDEAHRSTGNYAYGKIVAFIRKRHSHFRLLALTATPGNSIESVQSVIDTLGISRIEIRTEESLDIRSYLNTKSIDRVRVPLTEDIVKVQALFAAALQPLVDEMQRAGVLYLNSAQQINQFAAVSALQKYLLSAAGMAAPAGRKFHIVRTLKTLAQAGHAMALLTAHGIRPFYSFIAPEYKRITSGKSKSKLAIEYYGSDSMRECMEICEELLQNDSYVGHGKLAHLLDELVGFFRVADEDSRVIVFSSYRESALEIVRVLAMMSPTVRPHIFIGQSRKARKPAEKPKGKTKGKPKGKRRSKRKGKEEEDEQEDDMADEISLDIEEEPETVPGTEKRAQQAGIESSNAAAEQGMTQKTQHDVIAKFKAGTYNVLVATSVGEEGLDIGEVDLIVNYDSNASPIRNLQRMGRTGRKRDGKILVFLSGNEEAKFDKALDNYRYIQRQISDQTRFQYTPSARLLPAEVKPVCVRQEVQPPPENAGLVGVGGEEILKRMMERLKTAAGRKPKRKLQKEYFTPENAKLGFFRASALLEPQSGVKRGLTEKEEKKSEGRNIRESTNRVKKPRIRRAVSDSSDSDNPAETPTSGVNAGRPAAVGSSLGSAAEQILNISSDEEGVDSERDGISSEKAENAENSEPPQPPQPQEITFSFSDEFAGNAGFLNSAQEEAFHRSFNADTFNGLSRGFSHSSATVTVPDSAQNATFSISHSSTVLRLQKLASVLRDPESLRAVRRSILGD